MNNKNNNVKIYNTNPLENKKDKNNNYNQLTNKSIIESKILLML